MKYHVDVKLLDANAGSQLEDESGEDYARRVKEAEGKQFYRGVLIEESEAPMSKAFETMWFSPEQGPETALKDLRDMLNFSLRRRVCIRVNGLPPEPCPDCHGNGSYLARNEKGVMWGRRCHKPACQEYSKKISSPDLPKVELTVDGWPGEWEPLPIQIPVDPDAPPP
jgi:hypothetical protein